LYERTQIMLRYFKKISHLISTNFYFYDNTYNHINADLLRYYKTEYGNDWQAAIEYDQFKKGLDNEKTV